MAALGDESGTCDWSFSTVTYTVVEQRLTWSEAKGYCEARGGRLAQPDSLEKNENIKAKLQNIQEQCWFGLSKVADNQWQYTDGSATYSTPWGSGRGSISIPAYNP